MKKELEEGEKDIRVARKEEENGTPTDSLIMSKMAEICLKYLQLVKTLADLPPLAWNTSNHTDLKSIQRALGEIIFLQCTW